MHKEQLHYNNNTNLIQRAEFLANLYAAGPKSQSGVTMGTQPTTSPLAQAVGTGIGAFAAYQGI